MMLPNEHDATDQKPIAFCQNCGKGLDQDTVRVIGPAVYCEPCIAARLAGKPGAGSGHTIPSAGNFSESTWPQSPATPLYPASAAGPNPGLAALLGLIPGVGAMYNEQYAKGIVHLIVFAVLVSLSNVNGIFLLFVFGWIFYMAIEAHHTARARRDGTALPNPFGLNDIGERLGFGRAWPPGPGMAGMAHDAADAAANAFAGNPGTPPTADWRRPPVASSNVGAEAWTPVNMSASATTDPLSRPYTQDYAPNFGSPPPYTAPAQAYGTSFVPPSPGSEPSVAPVSLRRAQNGLPSGAIWLIFLGVFFLLTTTGVFHGIPPQALVGFVLIGLALWVFVRRMMESNAGLEDDRSAVRRFRVVPALRVPLWLLSLGILILLDVFGVLRWHRSWPLLVILAGLTTLLERTAYNAASVLLTHPAQPASPAASHSSFSGEVQTPDASAASDQTSDLRTGDK